MTGPCPRTTPLRTALSAGALALCALAAPLPPPAAAQDAARVSRTEGWPEADPEDVASIDAIIAALYDVISGPAGEARDWDRFRSLHVPEARLVPTGRTGTGDFRYQVMSPGDYIESSGAFLEDRGFFEAETARTTERFGEIAHAFSTYESRWNDDDPEPFQRGINSIQLMHDGERWWILTIFWAGERPDMRIPERYPGDPPG